MTLRRLKKKRHKHDVSETDDISFSEIIKGKGGRLLNTDGTFNIERKGLSAMNMYERILGYSWFRILSFSLLFYFSTNAIFAFIFLAIGPECIRGIEINTYWQNYTEMLFFSIQTFTTVGYGKMSPVCSSANLLASVVAFTGLISFALLTGLSFTKFSKPQTHIIFSRFPILGPNPFDNDRPSLQFRIVNTSKNQLIDLEARVTLAWLEEVDNSIKRRFQRLELELESIHLFPINWTIIHRIDQSSPLHGLSKSDMIAKHMELLILVKGFDDTYSQKIHTKRSYSLTNLVVGAKFKSMYENTAHQTVLDLSQIDDVDEYVFKD